MIDIYYIDLVISIVLLAINVARLKESWIRGLFPLLFTLTPLLQGFQIEFWTAFSLCLGYYFLRLYINVNKTADIDLGVAGGFLLTAVSWILHSLPLWQLVLPFLYGVYFAMSWRVRVRLNSSVSISLILLLEGFSSIFLASLTLMGTSNLASVFVGPWTGINVLWNALLGFEAVASSSYFMILMGLWLGVPLIWRIFRTKGKGNRVRLILMFLSYWVYSIYLPSFSPFQSIFPSIPYSWFNGFGTFGPVSPSLLTGIIGTYAVTAFLSYFFGGRQICSVTCTAPYMLQGFHDGLKTFNRTSRLGRKTLTSRLSPVFKVTSTLVWVNIMAFVILSYLNQLHLTSFYLLDNDPTVFLTSLYFNFIWYIQFLLAPLMGDYACVTQGLCGWGTFNQFFGYLGPFKLKVKDPSTCLNCRTVDCAKACPVGLTDMRASFLKRGEFKAFKCIGAGECIEECPHDNIFIEDGRVYLRKIASWWSR
ncbi:hypothetical protein L3N51_01553 [Metallosphaera sp. J1]|uniref:4Fe-4S binding protein n=1 Tax=Metallosphaera javensis (ex Hofmann et al. 2022) TaxID=99938 RepID=UPI001EE046EE|nr:4Fe-4S binding protein [Metallosphaera javensis (ex Hofmann et al. 2022)]MCG3109263.1 hypothetical protein [Metallosphaera javensis (ex Hofmann et al. 2022)]